MLIAVLGDTHFGARNDSPHFHDHFRKFYEEVFFPELKQRGITTVIQLGDLFDRRKHINFTTLKACREYFFDRIKEEGIDLHVLVGNHDVFYRNTNEVNSVELLQSSMEGLQCYTEPTEVEFDGQNIAIIPWINQTNAEQVDKFIADTKAQVAVAHLELQGFEMQRGVVMDHGMSANSFAKFDVVMTGHYHHKSHKGNIHYLGTPYQLTWADWGDERGFHVFDTASREIEFVRNPHSMFHKICYDDKDKEVGYIDTFAPSTYAGTLVKLIVKNKTNPVWFDQLVDRFESVKVCDIQVVEDQLSALLADDGEIVGDVEDTLTVLQHCVDQFDDVVDKPQLHKLLRSLYSEAISLERV